MCMLSHFSHVWLFATLWTTAVQAPLSVGFSRQEYWSRLLCPPPGDLPNPGTEPESPASPALAGGFFTTSATWEASFYIDYVKLYSYALQRSCLKPGAPPYKIDDYRKSQHNSFIYLSLHSYLQKCTLHMYICIHACVCVCVCVCVCS